MYLQNAFHWSNFLHFIENWSVKLNFSICWHPCLFTIVPKIICCMLIGSFECLVKGCEPGKLWLIKTSHTDHNTASNWLLGQSNHFHCSQKWQKIFAKIFEDVIKWLLCFPDSSDMIYVINPEFCESCYFCLSFCTVLLEELQKVTKLALKWIKWYKIDKFHHFGVFMQHCMMYTSV